MLKAPWIVCSMCTYLFDSELFSFSFFFIVQHVHAHPIITTASTSNDRPSIDPRASCVVVDECDIVSVLNFDGPLSTSFSVMLLETAASVLCCGLAVFIHWQDGLTGGKIFEQVGRCVLVVGTTGFSWS